MDGSNIVILIVGSIYAFLIGQIIAWGNIGNRRYSSWYETHFLVEKKGIFKWIYFKPKHFDRYTVYEVICFFASFLFPMIFGLLSIFLVVNLISHTLFNIVVGALSISLFFSQFVVVIINDIGSHRDEKKCFYLQTGDRECQNALETLPTPEGIKNAKQIKKVMQFYQQARNNEYFTIYNLKDSYHTRIKKAKEDIDKIEKINKEYIEHFKDIENLVVVKENKDGTLVFKE